MKQTPWIDSPYGLPYRVVRTIPPQHHYTVDKFISDDITHGAISFFNPSTGLLQVVAELRDSNEAPR